MASPPRSSPVTAALGSPDILPLILKKIPSLRDIVMVTGVSRFWRRTAHRTYSDLWLSDDDVNSIELNVLPRIRHFSQLTSLRILGYKVSEDSPFFLEGLAAAFPRLRELQLGLAFGSPPISPNSFNGLLMAFPLLENFTYKAPYGCGLLDPEVLSTLRHIKVLTVELEANLPESFYSLTTLRELNIRSYSRTRLSISPSITRLVNLTKLTGEDVDLPERLGVVPSLKVLELLSLEYDNQSRFPLPDLSDLPMLRSLTLYCSSLVTIDNSNHPLEPFPLPASLVSLDLYGFPFPSISGWFEKLRSLQQLELRNFSDLMEIPASIGMLTSLKVLAIDGCPCLKELPEEIAELQVLQFLSISDNESLESIPRALRSSSSLEWLGADDCPNLRLLPRELVRLIEESKYVAFRSVYIEYE